MFPFLRQSVLSVHFTWPKVLISGQGFITSRMVGFQSPYGVAVSQDTREFRASIISKYESFIDGWSPLDSWSPHGSR